MATPNRVPRDEERARQRFQPQQAKPDPKTEGFSSDKKRTYQDSVIRNPALPRDLKRPELTPIPQGSPKDPQPGSARYAANYANANLSEGSSPFKVAETQAHHLTPLKDSYDFLNGLTPGQQAFARAEFEAAGIYLGDTQLNTIHPRQPYHQGDQRWPHAYSAAVHPNLQDRVLEAQSGTNRWQHIPPEERLAHIPDFIEDARAGARLGQAALFEQTQLQPGNDAFENPFGGNFSQQVLAPESKQAHASISATNRGHRATIAPKPIVVKPPTNGQVAKAAATAKPIPKPTVKPVPKTRPVGTQAMLGGKPVVWNGKSWAPVLPNRLTQKPKPVPKSTGRRGAAPSNTANRPNGASVRNPGSASQQIRRLQNSTPDAIRIHPGMSLPSHSLIQGV